MRDHPARDAHVASSEVSDAKGIAAAVAAMSKDRLRSALARERRRKGLGIEEAAAGTGIEPGELKAIESGALMPEASTTARLFHLYDTWLDNLHPPRMQLDSSSFSEMSESEILTQYVGQVRSWRHSSKPYGFRQDDIQILEGILGTEASAVEAKLRTLTGCNRSTAKMFRRLFVLGLLASTGTVLGQGIAAASSGTLSSQRKPAAATAMAPSSRLAPAEVCKTLGATSVEASSSTSGSTSEAKANVEISAYVQVHVDAAGTPIAVRTNTGNAPECTGLWYVFGPGHPKGMPVDDLALMNEVVAEALANPSVPAPGSWRPGTWYALN
jgi:transcriptional regulator with XRE-family HTH domain